MEKVKGVLGRDTGNFLKRKVFHRRDFFRDLRHKSRFVSFAAVGNRGHIRAVGFDHEMLQRHDPCGFGKRCRTFEGDDPRKRNEAAGVHRL